MNKEILKGTCKNCLSIRNKQDLSGFSCVNNLKSFKDIELLDSCDNFKTGSIDFLAMQTQEDFYNYSFSPSNWDSIKLANKKTFEGIVTKVK